MGHSRGFCKAHLGKGQKNKALNAFSNSAEEKSGKEFLNAYFRKNDGPRKTQQNKNQDIELLLFHPTRNVTTITQNIPCFVALK